MQAWRGGLWSLVSPATSTSTSALSISRGGGGVGMKGSICRRGAVQSRSLDQVGDQVADGGAPVCTKLMYIVGLVIIGPIIVQELCESRGGRPGLSVLTSLLVSVDVKIY